MTIVPVGSGEWRRRPERLTLPVCPQPVKSEKKVDSNLPVRDVHKHTDPEPAGVTARNLHKSTPGGLKGAHKGIAH